MAPEIGPKSLGTFEKQGPVPKPFKILACDWAQKYFLCSIRVQLCSCYFRDFLFQGVHRQASSILKPVPVSQDSK